MSLSTQSYKGVRDFYPEDQFIQNYIFDIMRATVESFGYVEYNASILEESDLYRAKSGEEIVNEQTYSFTDRGDRDVTLRPEMTPTVARMVAARRRGLSFPLRWYSIPNLFRYERPQKGRLREHWQLNADLFGLESVEAELEMILLAAELMRNFGLSADSYVVRLNDRALVEAKMKEMELDEETSYKLQKLLDKKDKVKNFNEKAEELLGKPFEWDIKPSERVKELMDRLESLGVTNVEFSPTLMRGFDYYTGVVFEVFDTDPENNRSLFGGGRYDKLVDIFDEESVPAVGFGMGDVTIREALETRNLLPDYQSSADLYLCVLSPEYYDRVLKLAKRLRDEGVNVAIDFTDKRVGDQIQKADKDGVPFVICVGENEVASGTYSIKELATGTETEVPEEKITETIHEIRLAQ